MKHLLSGNEAIARGLFEAGVTLCSGYPGTPSTEILENCARRYHDAFRSEWAPNEKVALEVAAGAAMAGARAAVTMKHVGLNVAADPLLSLAYTGTPGGLVLVVADDPGMHSSQNEQDSRHYARLAKVPILEPSDSAEALAFTRLAFEISEKYRTPVILRTTTRVSHSRSLVEFGEPATFAAGREIGFSKDPANCVLVPAFARKRREAVEERLARFSRESATWGLNRVVPGGSALGIITEGIAFQYVREVFPDAAVLKLGCVFPFPEAEVREFAGSVEKLLVVEELEDFTEMYVRALGLECTGKTVAPNIGELTPDVLRQVRARLEGASSGASDSSPAPARQSPEVTLPNRPPTLCAGCPHRALFYALKNLDVDVTGDIGCYSLGVQPPLNALDTIICMGAGFSMAHGMAQSGQKRKVVGVLGDSTFFHSGITGLLNIAWNRVNCTVIVLDNRITAMTGHQDNPGTGRTLMGEPTGVADIAEIGRACGIQHIAEFDPLDYAQTVEVLRRATESPEPWLLISKSPCVLILPERVGPVRRVDAARCRNCRVCLKTGCPAIESTGKTCKPTIQPQQCNGCGLCAQVCKFAAIVE